MYAQVVVLTYQPPQVDSYTYKVPDNLKSKIKPGQLVTVPFGKRNPQGVVINTRSDLVSSQTRSDLVVKPVTSLVLENPLLLPYQLELLKWLSFFYIAPTVNCLKTMLPQIPKRLDKYEQPPISKQNQTLVLVPSINRIAQTLANFPKSKNYTLYHNQLKTSEMFTNWLKIKSGQVDYIFGSRNAIFTPCVNLKKIIIYDEHESAYKDERSPYFDTLNVVQKISNLTNAKLEIIDSTPKITTYFAHKPILQIPKLNLPKVKIASMAQEKKLGNFTPISQSLNQNLKLTLKQGGNALLFLNKKAESGQVYCKSCNFQGFKRTQPNECPNCQSKDIWFYTINLNSLSSIVKRFVGNIPTRLIFQGSKDQTYTNGQKTVDIATSTIFYSPILKKYDLVCYMLVDSTLNIPDFATSEKVFGQITDLKKITKDNGLVILQTHNPHSVLINNAGTGNYKNYLNDELKTRKVLHYPPFALIIKLSIRGTKENVIEQKAQKLLINLKSELAQGKKLNVTILGPYKPVFWSEKVIYNIILKIPLNSFALEHKENAMKNIRKYLQKLDPEWQIIIEPDSLN